MGFLAPHYFGYSNAQNHFKEKNGEINVQIKRKFEAVFEHSPIM